MVDFREETEKDIIKFLESRGGKAPLISIQKNVNWTVDGRQMIFEVLKEMEKQGLIKIEKNGFGIDMAILK